MMYTYLFTVKLKLLNNVNNNILTTMSDTRYENMHENASFSRMASGSLFDIKKFLETDCVLKPNCDILYTSMLDIVITNLFKELSDKEEDVVKNIFGHLKFKYTGDGMTCEDFKILFDSYNLSYSDLN